MKLLFSKLKRKIKYSKIEISKESLLQKSFQGDERKLENRFFYRNELHSKSYYLDIYLILNVFI